MNRSAKTFTLEGHKGILLQYITPDLNDLLSGLVLIELNMIVYKVLTRIVTDELWHILCFIKIALSSD